MYVNDKCPCGNKCCSSGTCAACANDAIDGGAMDREGCCGQGGGASMMSHQRSPLVKVLALLLMVFLASLIVNNIRKFKYIGRAPTSPYTITIAGMGKVTATPTIAVTNVGLVTEKLDVAAAQAENSEKINKLIAAMKALEISSDDIKTTQYQIYPKYSYEEKRGSQITGYSVTQSVEVKIRDLAKISQVLAKAGEAGANQVSGIQFTIDDPKNLRAEAREQAVKDAKEKAEKLAAELGVHLGKVVNFSEMSGGGPQMPMHMYAKESSASIGGAAPDVQAGTLEINSEVAVTYEIK